MKVYTRTGDKGQTSLASGERLSKADPRVDAYGTVDELNSFVGLLRSEIKRTPGQPDSTEIDSTLNEVQNELFSVSTHLATIPSGSFKPNPLKKALVSKLEKEMDRFDESLPPLKNFILPGGTPASTLAHVCRTVCRRAERLTVGLQDHHHIEPDVVIFLNRLSDYFFCLSRWLNFKANEAEVVWKP